MAGNIYAGGADTSGMGRRGAQHRTNPNRNRGGGGGGGGGNKNKVPKGGLYGGKAGEAAANQNPEAYLEALFRHAGVAGSSPGTDFDTFLSDYATQDMIKQYQNRGADNQRDSIEDWMNATYGGAGFHGKRGNQFSAGTVNEALQKQYGTWSSNQNPLTYAQGQQAGQGLTAINGNDQFQQWLTQTYNPQLEGQFRTRQQADPSLNFDAWYASQDPEAARRAYANRSPSQRQPTGAPVGGRYSWWA